MFFLDAFLDLIFLHFMLILVKMCDFWTPSEPSGAQNGAQNCPSGAKKTEKAKDCGISTIPETDCCPRGHPKSPEVSILVDFGWILDEQMMKFGIISEMFSLFCLLHFRRQCRLFLPASCFKMVSFHGQRSKVSAVALQLQSKEHGAELPRASRARSGSDSVSKSVQMVKNSPKMNQSRQK